MRKCANETFLTADPKCSISAIVLWEIAKLHQLGRAAYELDHETFAIPVDRVHVWRMTRQACLNSRALHSESDLANEIIAATSLIHNIPLLTRDSRLRKSGAVKLV